jgi:hypothetical protein
VTLQVDIERKFEARRAAMEAEVHAQVEARKVELDDIMKLTRMIFLLSLPSVLCLKVRYEAPSHRK